MERVIAPGESHAYDLILPAGTYLRLALRERGAKVAGLLVAPSGKRVAGMDLTIRRMIKLLSVVSGPAGRYRLILTAKSGTSGGYTLSVEEWRPARPADSQRVAAQQVLSRGQIELLRGGKGADQRAREWFAEARKQSLRAGDTERATEALVASRGIDADTGPLKQLPAVLADLEPALRVSLQPAATAALDAAARAQFRLDHIAEAIQLKQRAFEFWQRLGEPADAAEAATDLGYYYGPSDKRQAEAWFDKALLLRQQAGDLTGEARTQNALGVILDAQLDPDRARKAYERALALSQQADSPHEEAQAWSNLGALSHRHGDLQTAIGQYERSVVLSAGDPNQLGRIYQNLGSLHVELGDFEAATGDYNLTLRLSSDDEFRGNALINLGFVQLKKKQPRAALDQLESALHLNLQPRQRGLALHYMGRAYLELGRAQQALDSLRQAFEIRRGTRERQELTKTRIEIGRAYLALGERNLAAEQFTLAESTQNPAIEAACRFNLALLERDAKHFEKARAEVEKALQILEPVRSRFARDKTRTSFSATLRDFYELKVDLLLRQGRVPEALVASEQAHARGLLDLLSQGRIDVKGRVSPQLQKQESELDQELYLAEGQLAAAQPGEEVQSLTQRRNEIELRQETLANEIRKQDQRYAEVRQPKFLNISAIASNLEEGTALLEYLVGEKESWLFVVTRGGLTSYPLGLSRAEIEKRVKDVRDTISQPTKHTLRSFCKKATDLYRKIFAPATALLAGKPHLVIVPDGALHLLPFEVLLTRDTCHGEDQSFAQLPYLLREHTFSYVPSANVLRELRIPRPSPVAPPDSQSLRFLAFANPITNREALAQSETEVDQIAGLYPPLQVRKFVGREANKSKVRDWVTHADQIQFATHGQFDEERPELSGLVLTPEGGTDGLLRVSEVFDLKLHADLVVLSGCETGLGKQVTGEGLIGLTRAFFYAGAPSLVVSLWRVADEATPRLMLDFYKRLNQGADKGEALQLSKLAMLASNEYSHPYHWAPFVLVGDPKSKK